MSKKINNEKVSGDAISVPVSKEKPGMGTVGNGAMGSATFSEATIEKVEQVAVQTKSEKTVALYSSRNVSWLDVGSVVRGYNIVSESAAEKWLTRSHIRIATPEEVAGAYKN
jgi:hypothetical protein